MTRVTVTRALLRVEEGNGGKGKATEIPTAELEELLPTESLAAFRREVDDLVCLEDYESFGAIGFYYSDFRQISDEEVIETLARFPARTAKEPKESHRVIG